MDTCFVIQPFDSGKFDKRFTDIYKPAIEAAGLEAYRVDKDSSVSVPIDAIEAGIRSAAICLADITADNPNVWYELGYAFATDRPVIMVCSEERTGKKYPFDIQHRTIIPYLADAPSDFERLREKLTSSLKAQAEKGAALRNMAEAGPIATIEGLSYPELTVLAILAGYVLPGGAESVYSAKLDAEKAGITNIGFNLALKRLQAKSLVEIKTLHNDFGNEYDAASVTEAGWRWIDANDSNFLLHRSTPKDGSREKVTNIPF